MGERFLAKLSSFEDWTKKWWAKALLFTSFFVFVLLLHFAFCFRLDAFYDTISPNEHGFRSVACFYIALALFLLSVLLCVLFILFLWKKRALNERRLLFALTSVTAFLVLFLSGVRNFNNNAFTHDFAVFSDGGHWSIIYDIYKDGAIPPVDLDNQYYQVKFYHAIVAYFARFFGLFIPKTDVSIALADGSALSLGDAQALECIRILRAYMGVLLFYFIARIFLLLFKGKDRKAVLSSCFCFATPALYFVIFSGNNDLFALFFSLLSLLLALEWRERRTYVLTALLALSIAAAMESKLNSALIAFPIAYLFLAELLSLWKRKKEGRLPKKEWRSFFWMIALFALLVFPLSLFGSVYQSVVYNEPFGYVLDLERNGPNYMHVDNAFYTPFFRLFAFPSPDLFFSYYNVRAYFPISGGPSSQYVFGTIDFNAWTAFIKTSLYEEHYPLAFFGYTSGGVLLSVLFYALAVLVSLIVFAYAIFSLVRYAYEIKEKERKALPSESAIFLLIIFLTQATAYLYFCYRYPVGCTMNARYALLLYLPFGACFASFLTSLGQRKRAPIFKKGDPSL